MLSVLPLLGRFFGARAAYGPAVQVTGLSFPNRVGLAAGFDKNAVAIEALARFGFGFIEVGTVTTHPQEGNPRPRLFRLKADEALLNRFGFNNEGAEVIGRRLARLREKGFDAVPIGVNLGRSKVVDNRDAPADVARAFRLTARSASYVVLNVSSPNTPGLRDLQRVEEISRLLEAVLSAREEMKISPPVLVKLAPDLADEDAIACAQKSLALGAAGIVATNTTISRAGLVGPVPEGPGGVSGRPLFRRSTDLLRVLRAELGSEPALIGVGGILSEQDALEKRSAGADLVQVYTGFVYVGPSFPSTLAAALAAAEKSHSSAPR